jgi:hypothetical protein
MPDVSLQPDPTSGARVVGWQHVVALALETTQGSDGPVMLISCLPMAASPGAEDLVDSCVTQILGRVAGLRASGALEAGAHKIRVVAGPKGLLESLCRPLSGATSTAADQDRGKRSAGWTNESVIEIPGGWGAQADRHHRVMVAWPAGAPERAVRLARRGLIGGAYAEETASKDIAQEAVETRSEQEFFLPLAFERARLLVSDAVPDRTQELCMRFVPPPLPDGSRAAVDTGAMRLSVPQGWKVLYFEERLRCEMREAREASGQWEAPGGLWPCLPTASDQDRAKTGRPDQGVLAIGGRAGKVSAALVGLVSPSEQIGPLLPALQEVLDSLRLAGTFSPPEPTPQDQLPTISVSLDAPAQGMPPDYALLAGSPEWIALMLAQEEAMLAQDEEILARNQAILEGREVVDLELEAVMARMEEAVQRLNEEILAFYPEGGDPPGWMQERLGELLQEISREEVMWQ